MTHMLVQPCSCTKAPMGSIGVDLMLHLTPKRTYTQQVYAGVCKYGMELPHLLHVEGAAKVNKASAIACDKASEA